jgi:outer membrane protease
MLYGQVEEIVYPYNAKAKYLSQLLWDVKPLFYLGALLDLTYRNPAAGWGFFSDLSVKAGIPGRTGKMEDQDWQAIDSDAVTDYSVHDNETVQFFWVEGGAGIFVPIRERFTFRLSMDVSYMRFSFSGMDGHGLYDNLTVSHPFSGKVINYTQNWFIVTPAVSLNAHFLNRFTAGLFFQISPLVWCIDHDEHLTTGKQYRDYMRWGLFLEPRASFSFAFNRRFAVSADLAYRYITGSRGETYQSPLGQDNYSASGEAGSGLSLMDAGLMFKVQF